MDSKSSANPHVIRLRGPWNYEITADGAAPRGGTFDLAADWRAILGESRQGILILRRRFGRPGHLDADERVTLVLSAAWLARASLSLNAAELRFDGGDTMIHRLAITQHLQPRNELSLRFEFLPADQIADHPLEDVRLEIDFCFE